jgi:nitrite reductase/ring-hydroxylating ferredoxin subunit
MPKYNWKEIQANNLPQKNKISAITIGRKRILVTNAENYYAFGSKCPHAGGNLEFGSILNGCEIECPLHRYVFNFKTGKMPSGPGLFLETYPIKLENNRVYVGFPTFFSWLYK